MINSFECQYSADSAPYSALVTQNGKSVSRSLIVRVSGALETLAGDYRSALELKDATHLRRSKLKVLHC